MSLSCLPWSKKFIEFKSLMLISRLASFELWRPRPHPERVSTCGSHSTTRLYSVDQNGMSTISNMSLRIVLIHHRAAAARFRMLPFCVLTLLHPTVQLTIPASYPKHVWSPAGGWYAQPANWKANTAVMGVIIFGLTAFMWSVSAEREVRTRFPEEGRFFPSR
jgi:hypothetical protein